MATYRKKPVVVEAIQWTGDNIRDVERFMFPAQPVYMNGFVDRDEFVGIQTLEGLMVARKSDWIIRGLKGELYPCKPDIFTATYDPVE